MQWMLSTAENSAENNAAGHTFGDGFDLFLPIYFFYHFSVLMRLREEKLWLKMVGHISHGRDIVSKVGV